MRPFARRTLWLIFALNAVAFFLPFAVGVSLVGESDSAKMAATVNAGLLVVRMLFALGVVAATASLARILVREPERDRLLLGAAVVASAWLCARIAAYAVDVDVVVLRLVDVIALPDLLLLLVFRRARRKSSDGWLLVGMAAASVTIALALVDVAIAGLVTQIGAFGVVAVEGPMILAAVACWVLMLRATRALPVAGE